VVVNYIPQRPVRVVIRALRVKGAARDSLPQKESTDNLLRFDVSPRSRVTVLGQVTWDPESDRLMRKEFPVHFYVNGLRQLPVDLETAEEGRRTRTFQAELSLTRGKDNRIQVELPDELKRSTDNEPVCVVDCAKPVERQRVYLLPVSVGETDEAALMKGLYKALQADTTDLEPNRFKTPVFFEGRVYGPLTGYVNRRQVLTQLNRIKEDIRDRKQRDLRGREDAPADVLMLYFRGADSIGPGNYVLRTSDRKVAITRDELLRQFQATLGAQIVFLDVAREPAAEVVRLRQRLDHWPDDSRVSVFRYAWMDPKVVRQDEPWLIKALADALRQDGRLQEVAVVAKTQYEKLAREKARLSYYEYYPQELAELLLGKKGAE
jgi:hypothetical protein